jgi:hypothetical protein
VLPGTPDQEYSRKQGQEQNTVHGAISVVGPL